MIPYLLRARDVFVASTPLFVALLIGTMIWKALERRLRGIPKDCFSGILLSGGVVVQSVTWSGALFSRLLASAAQYATLTLGLLSFALLVRSPAALRRKHPIFGMTLARGSAFLGLAVGFVLADSRVPQSIPSDAIGYHIPISSWFARGGAWSFLPNHIWPSQWPLASSLWSSFVMGRLPITDRLVAWSAQNYAFIVWTASVVFAAVQSSSATDRRRDWMAWFLSLSLLVGAYSGYQRLGFVDYRAGFFAAALMATLVQMTVSATALPLAVVLASTVAEFRPQGLLYAVTLLVCWAGISPNVSAEAIVPPKRKRRRPRARLPRVMLFFAGLFFAKWWLLVWIRWGSPAPPIFARRLNLTPTQKYADELFHIIWPPDLRRGLQLVFWGDRDAFLIAFLLWVLVLLALARAVRWRSRIGEEPQLLNSHRVVEPLAILSPVAACVFLATRIPSEATRMLPPLIPATCIIAVTVLGRTGAGSRTGKRIGDLFAWLFLGVGVLSAPAPWERPHAERGYPGSATVYYSQVEEQLNELRDYQPLVFDQYIAFLPVGFKQMGVTYGPWARLPKRPLRTLHSWMEWLRENEVGAVVVAKGQELKGTWEWTPERTEPPDFSVLDRWISACPDQVVVGQYIMCRVAAAAI